MPHNNITVKEATEESMHKHVTANELDILVSKTRQMNRQRDRDLDRLNALLTDIEERVLGAV